MLSKKEMSDEPWSAAWTIKRDEIKAGTFWSELRRISEWDGKLGVQRTGLERRALVPLRWSQPLESPWSSEIDLVLCA